MDPDTVLAESRRYPLNLKRLAAAHLQSIADALGLLKSSSLTDELRQMIDGKLADLHRESQNVQVAVLEESGVQIHLYLLDASGIFSQAQPFFRSQPSAPEQTDELQELQQAVEELRQQNQDLEVALEGQTLEMDGLRRALEQTQEELASERQRANEAEATPSGRSDEELERVQESLKVEKERVQQIWRINCQQLAEYDEALEQKDQEIAEVTAQLRRLKESSRVHVGDSLTHHEPSTDAPTSIVPPPRTVRLPPPTLPAREGDTPEVGSQQGLQDSHPGKRRGKAPPIDPFTGENPEIRLDDWLPSLQRASRWNQWTEEEQLIQLAGHLRGRALQEWNLLGRDSQQTFGEVDETLRGRLEPQSRALAAQDFRHTSQGDQETVADFIRRLERTFTIAYGQDGMSLETRQTLLHGQLQEGLRYNLMKAPAVSGAQTYSELCMAAKNEEKHQAELKKWQEYQRPTAASPVARSFRKSWGLPSQQPQPNKQPTKQQVRRPQDRPRCYNCGSTDHLARDCKAQTKRQREMVVIEIRGELP